MRRGETWYLRKVVPKRFQSIEARSEVWLSLQTDSENEARATAPVIERALREEWQARLAAGGCDDTVGRAKAIRALAAVRGIVYRPVHELAEGPLAELLERLERVAAAGADRDRPGAPEIAAAELGGAPDLKVRLSGILEAYLPLIEDRYQGKSEDQIRRHKAPRIKAVGNLIKIIGDKALHEVTRTDALAFRSWWQTRIATEGLTANSANKDIGHLSEMFGTIERMLQAGLVNPFERLRLVELAPASPRPFSTHWIRDHLLAKGALDRLNIEARDILLTMVNTGARPSEIIGLNEANIRLEATIPHIHISAEGRQLKTPHSERVIPLVGASLEAMQRHPEGFPRYRERPTSAVNLINKYLRNNGLLEHPKCSAYSLRHAFEDRLLAAEAPDRLRADLMGHKIERPRYGLGPDLEQRLKWIERINAELSR